MDGHESSLKSNRRLASHSALNMKLHMTLHNLMVQIVLLHLNQIDPNSKYFNDSVVGITFEEFLDSDHA